MANLPENEVWEDVYQWETSDRALGGPGGVMNKPLLNLVNRTAFLKKSLDGKASTTPASLNNAGIVKLSNAINSDSNADAATASAVKKAYDLAASKLGSIPFATANEILDGESTETVVSPETLQGKGHFYSNVELLTTSKLTAAHFGARFWVDHSSPSAFTLPDISNIVGCGHTITIWNVKSSAITISVGDSADNISIPMSTVKTFKLMPTESVTLIVEQSHSWHATGDGMLKYSLLFRSSVTENGWGYQPSGLIEQWGACNVSGNGSVDGGYLNNFSIPFPNKCINIQLTHSGFSPGSVGVFSALVLSNNSQFRAYSSAGNVYPAGTAYYRAIGY
ncbi:phage tail protein [Limnobaculum xujianqingii]|uniref:phage tail protein n=1 Tax=Limnobaculum xujianqingii TaxID=2738837 RepID=UPI00112E61C8|nr:phage tail protein [Limnobaculum xujianqingii]